MTSILNPSYAIEPRFVNYVITTKDGRMYDGIIANETTWLHHAARRLGRRRRDGAAHAISPRCARRRFR